MSNKKKDKEGLWQRISRRYDVVATRRGFHDIEYHLSVSRLGVAFCSLVAVVLVVAITTAVLFYTPMKRYMPGYVSPEQRELMLEASLRVDSLYETVQRHQLYVMNLQDIFRGEIKIDSVSTIDSITVLRSTDLMGRTERESEFVRQYEENEKYNLTSLPLRKSDMEGLHFATPLRGMLSETFNPTKMHFGVDLVPTGTNQNVGAVLDGTVVMCGYTPNDGYVVMLQHVGNLVTIYKHLSANFRNEGDKVKAGEPIGTLNKPTDKQRSQTYLHFELWHKGTALDPTQYISF
ncbi:MAG: M23 family metallopeptidase [Bacteroidaceae bacterium]|nr:M23 family metallopeptidase [Bacteroidaceae bacterium]MBR5841499.1 M23 family metallopeptidase [Bacteroidaceae bacterium]